MQGLSLGAKKNGSTMGGTTNSFKTEQYKAEYNEMINDLVKIIIS